MKDIIVEKAVKIKDSIKSLVSAPKAAPDYVALAMGEVGVRERSGGENPRIIEYHQATTLRATEDEIAWCASFINWVLMKTGYERSHSAAARSFLGVPTKLKGFEKYAIVVFKRGNSSWQGHVAIALEQTKTHVRCIGGNQSNAVSIASYSKADVLAYIRPKKLS